MTTAGHALTPRTYTTVCVILVVLTFLTVGFSFMPLPGVWHIVFGLLIALCKASLVVLFFMHVIASERVVWIVIAVSAFWLGILVILTLCDYFTRGMLPFMPGH